MQKAHQNINWKNKPNTETPINETNLNLMDRSIDTIDDRVVAFDTTKANQVDLLQACKAPTFDETTGILSFPLFNGTVVNIDTKLEKMPVNLAYDSNPSSPHYQHLILTLDDGTVEYIDLSALITQYEFVNSPRIAFTVGADGSISADIIGGSITDDKMQPQYLADITAQANAGAQSAINASNFKLDSEAWAVGTRNGQAVPQSDPAWHNNSRWWSQQANVTSLAALTDVSIDDPQDLQYLGYDATEEVYTLMDIPQQDAGVPVRIIVISEEGSTVTITKPNGDTVTPTHVSTGHWQADFSGAGAYGTYVIDAVLNGDDAQVNLIVDDCKTYIVDDSHFHADITVTYPSGATVSCSKTGEQTMYATSSPYTFTVHSTGVWTITGTRNGVTETQTVTITTNGQSESVTLTILPDGPTVTPTDSIPTLLHCADIWDKSYTSIGEVLDDSDSLFKILTTDNSIDYLVRSTTYASSVTADSDAMAMIGSYDYCADTLLSDSTWVTAIGGSAYFEPVENAKVPIMTSNTTPSGEAFSSTNYSGYDAWKAFNGNNTSAGWVANTSDTYGNAYVGYYFNGKSVKLAQLQAYLYYNSSTNYHNIVKVQGSNNGEDWTDVATNLSTPQTNILYKHSFPITSGYKYYRMVMVSGDSITGGSGWHIQFYGRCNGGVQTWLRAGGITDKSYTTLAEVLADTTTLSALISNHNAVDYLVTAKGLIDGIVADSNAMSYIGLNNYCANTLLADADWCTGIRNSTYFESVLNVKVPTMTSNTTPSGVCSASSEGSGQEAYKAFDGTTDFWNSTQANAPVWLQYEFANNTKVYLAEVQFANYASSSTVKIQKSDSTDIYDSVTISGTTKTKIPVNGGDWKAYRMYVSAQSKSSSYAGVCQMLQFYGREDV